MAAGGAPMVKVYYGKPMLPDVSRVLACLYEKEVDFKLVDMYEGQHMSTDFLRLQVAARLPVPCLEDGSNPVFESRAICRYLVEKYPDSGNKYLLGRDLLERASIEQWLKTEEHSFDPPSWALIFHLAFPPTASFPEPDRALATQNERRLAKVLDVYEQRLGETNYLAGNKFSLADLSHLSNSHHLARSEEWGNLFDSRKNVRKWWSKISNRPSWKEVVKILDRVGILKPTLPASAESALQSLSKSTPSSPGVQLMPSSPGVQPIILGHIPGYGHTASTTPSSDATSNFQLDSITQPLSPQPVEEPAREISQKTLLPSTGQSSGPPPLDSPTTQPAKLVSAQPIPPQSTTTQLPSTGQPPLVTPEMTQPTMPAPVQPIPSLAATTQPTQPASASQPAEKPTNDDQQTRAVLDQRITPLATPIIQSTLPPEPNAKQSPPPDMTSQSTARPVPTSQPTPQPTTTTNELSPPTGQNTQLSTRQNPPFAEPYSLKMPSPKPDAKFTPPAQHTLEQASPNTQAVPQSEPTYPSAAQHGHQAGLTAATTEPTAPEISSKESYPNARQTTKPKVIPDTPAEKIDTNTKPASVFSQNMLQPGAPTADTTASTIARWKTEMNLGATQPGLTAPTGQTTSASVQPTFDPAAPPKIQNNKPGTTTDSAPASLSTPQIETSLSQPDPQTKQVTRTDSSASNTSRPETDINIMKTTPLPAPNAPQTDSANAHPDPQTKQATTTSNIPHPETDVHSRDAITQPAETAPNTQTTSASGKPARTDVNSTDITTQPAESAPNTRTSASAKPVETYVNYRGSTTQPAKTSPDTQTASAKPTMEASVPDKRSDLHPVTTNTQSSVTAASTIPTAPSTPQQDTPTAPTDTQTKQASQPNSPPSTPPDSVDE